MDPSSPVGAAFAEIAGVVDGGEPIGEPSEPEQTQQD
jgi:hypothetical protein